MSDFGMRTFDENGRDTLHFVSNFMLEKLILSGTGSKTYAVQPGTEIYLSSMRAVSTSSGRYIHTAGDTISWSVSSATEVMIMCMTRVV